MLRARIDAVELVYGCHDAAWTLPPEPRPVVIAGPNGSGKTTLIEGVIRTLFGFDRRKTAETDALEAARPWSGEGMRGRVLMTRYGESYEIDRDFTTDRVRVLDPGRGVERFAGDGNPAARNQEARQYRALLTELLGLSKLEAYRRTLLIRQGELVDTELGEHLLRVAAGGHARVEAARTEIGQAHRSLTRRPLQEGAGAAVNPRELEKLDEELAGVRARLKEALQAAERRGPLTLDRDRAATRLKVLDEEIEALEAARSVFGRSEAAELGARRLRERSRELENAVAALVRAENERTAARAALEDATKGGRYPDDFPERLARAEVRWRDLEQLKGFPAPWLAAVAGSAVVVGAGLLLAGFLIPAGVGLGLATVLGVAWATLRWGVHRRRQSVRSEIRRALEGVPHRGSVSEATRGRHLARYRAQVAAEQRLESARAQLARAVHEGRAALRASLEGEEDPPGEDPEGEGDPAATGTASARLGARLRARAEAIRERLARDQVRLEQIGEATLDLPQDVPPTDEAVAEALRSRREERAETQVALQELGQELLERGAPPESVGSLESRLRALEPRREEVARQVAVLEAAHALVTDAYGEFRDRDQERLVALVSSRIRELGGDRIGPLVVDGELDGARVRVDGRVVPMASPPLSFGEYHAALLGVRLGTADFLAGVGVLPPLLVDEPFAHLDVERARSVWTLLERVAKDRQVLVTSQDALLLEALGIRPTIMLSG